MSEATLPIFLPGVPEVQVRVIFTAAAGNEIESGKSASSQSSAALAGNGFGWFLNRPEDLRMFPPLCHLDGPVVNVEIKREIRFPWSDGRYPWLGAVVETESDIIGVEWKRFEPFRDHKCANLSEAYDRDVWVERIESWCEIGGRLRGASRLYRHLDAAQLVKHTFALAPEATRYGKQSSLVYLYAEPIGGGRPSGIACLAHRRETDHFAAFITSGRVRFVVCSWRGWLTIFKREAASHAERVIEAFTP